MYGKPAFGQDVRGSTQQQVCETNLQLKNVHGRTFFNGSTNKECSPYVSTVSYTSGLGTFKESFFKRNESFKKVIRVFNRS